MSFLQKISYVHKVLQPGEQVLKIGKLHWIIYQPAIIVFILAVLVFWIMGTSYFVINIVEFVVLAAAVCLAVAAWLDQLMTEIAVTNRRVIYKRGFIWRYTAEMNMDKVESVTVTQSILGRILNYGSIHIRGTGEGIKELNTISKPIEFRNSITSR